MNDKFRNAGEGEGLKNQETAVPALEDIASTFRRFEALSDKIAGLDDLCLEAQRNSYLYPHKYEAGGYAKEVSAAEQERAEADWAWEDMIHQAVESCQSTPPELAGFMRTYFRHVRITEAYYTRLQRCSSSTVARLDDYMNLHGELAELRLTEQAALECWQRILRAPQETSLDWAWADFTVDLPAVEELPTGLPSLFEVAKAYQTANENEQRAKELSREACDHPVGRTEDQERDLVIKTCSAVDSWFVSRQLFHDAIYRVVENGPPASAEMAAFIGAYFNWLRLGEQERLAPGDYRVYVPLREKARVKKEEWASILERVVSTETRPSS